MSKKKPSQIGNLKPKHRFFLNHYKEYRFTTCPQCERLMKVRKYPFFIVVFPEQPLILNMSGKFCPSCDLLILHQDKVEELLTAAMIRLNPDLIGNEYVVIGTLERKGWLEGQKNPHGLKAMFEHLHDFKESVFVEVQPAHWGPAEDP